MSFWALKGVKGSRIRLVLEVGLFSVFLVPVFLF